MIFTFVNGIAAPLLSQMLQSGTQGNWGRDTVPDTVAAQKLAPKGVKSLLLNRNRI